MSGRRLRAIRSMTRAKMPRTRRARRTSTRQARAGTAFQFASSPVPRSRRGLSLPRRRLFAAGVCAAGHARADSFDAHGEAMVRPPFGERLALSPAGRRLADTTRTRGALASVIAAVADPGPKRTVPVTPERDEAGADDGAPAPLDEEPPAGLCPGRAHQAVAAGHRSARGPHAEPRRADRAPADPRGRRRRKPTRDACRRA